MSAADPKPSAPSARPLEPGEVRFLREDLTPPEIEELVAKVATGEIPVSELGRDVAAKLRASGFDVTPHVDDAKRRVTAMGKLLGALGQLTAARIPTVTARPVGASITSITSKPSASR